MLKFDTMFIQQDREALQKIVTMVLKQGIMVAEIGSWLGCSTLVLAKAVLPYDGSVFAIDHWKGSLGAPTEKEAKNKDIYSIFKQNMIEMEVWDIVHPLIMDSMIAAKIFKDRSLDLVFIDGDHRYNSVIRDILHWLPKLRNDGILSGHDCYGYYSDYSEEIRDIINNLRNEERAVISGLDLHPGVIIALYHCFNRQYTIIPESCRSSSCIWYIEVEKVRADQKLSRRIKRMRKVLNVC